jgi:hypothetical protein
MVRYRARSVIRLGYLRVSYLDLGQDLRRA